MQGEEGTLRDELVAILSAKRDSITQSLIMKRRGYLGTGERTPDFVDGARAALDEDVQASIAAQESQELQAIQAAMARIMTLGDNELPTCVACGDEISRQRLIALPTTRTCITCARKSGKSNFRPIQSIWHQ